MDIEALEPMNYDTVDDPIDFQSANVVSVGFSSPTFDNIDYGMSKPAWTGPGTIDFTSLQFDSVNANSMGFGVTNSGSTESGDTEFSRNTWATTGSGLSGLYEMGFCPTESETTHALMAASDTIGPATLNPGTGGTDNLGGQQIQFSYQKWQSSTAGPCDGTSNGCYHLQHSQTIFPHPTPPKGAGLRGIPESKNMRSGNWKKYQPKSFDMLVTRKQITADDWEDHRPFIEQLYLVENVKLEDVMQIMAARFGFVASKKMYNTKIKQWGLMKNYKASEKEQLARIVKAHRDSGKDIPPLTLRNRAAKMDRVRRFCKQQKILKEIWDALPAESCSKATTSSPKAPPVHRAAAIGVIASAIRGVCNSPLSPLLGSRKISFDPERPFSTASKDSRIELILFQMKMYYQSQIDCTIQLNRLMSAAMLDNRARFGYTWEGKLVYGAGMIRQQKLSQGWKMINEACDMAHQILDQPHQSFFRHLLSAFDDPDLALYPDLRTYILRFFTKASATKLGCKHPVSIILYHLQEPQILEDVVPIALEVLMDVAGEKLDPENPEIWSLNDFYCSILRWRGDYAAAESYGQRFLKQFEEVFGQFHRRTQGFQAALSINHYFQGLDELAERGYQDSLQRGREDLGYRFYALRPLAWIWEERDFTQSEEYWRQALADAIEVWGVEPGFSTSQDETSSSETN